MNAPRLYFSLLLAALALVVTGCPKEKIDPIPPPPTECTAGASGACTCSGGLSGSRTCSASGSWNACVCTCTPNCAARACGPDPACGMSCGSCGQDMVCSDAGQCMADCSTACIGRECGVESRCGMSCGNCGDGASCDEPSGQCMATTLAIEGRTIANASISALVGATTLTAMSNASGGYFVVIGGAGGDPDTVVTVKARGTGMAAAAELASVVGTIGELTALAGMDLTVDATELNSVLVTAQSTAKYAALYAINAGKAPATAAELAAAEENMNEPLGGFEMFDVAAGLQMIIDGDALDLPTGFTTTLQLAENIYALRDFIAPYQFPELFDPHPLFAGRQAILDATEDHARFTAGELTSFFAEMLKTRDGYIGEGDERWDFDPAGTGVFHDYISPNLPPLKTFTWSIEQDHLKVTFDDTADPFPPFLYTEQIAARIADANLKQEVRNALGADGGEIVPREILGVDIVLLQHGDKMDWVVVRERVLWHFDVALAGYGILAPAAELLEHGGSDTWRRASSLELIPLVRDEILGDWALDFGTMGDHPFVNETMALPMIGTARVTFREDGTATASFGRNHVLTELTWELDGDGKLLIHDATGPERIYAKWTSMGATVGLLSWYKPTPAETYTYYGRNGKFDPMFSVTEETMGTADGDYWQTTINYVTTHKDEQGNYPDMYNFGFLFQNGAAAARLTVFEMPREVVLEEDWSWAVNGREVHIERRWDSALGVRCAYTDPSCIAYRHRVWEPIAVDGQYLLVLEHEVWLQRYSSIRNGTFTWDAMRGQWVDSAGAPLDLEDLGYLAFPRFNAYYIARLPPP